MPGCALITLLATVMLGVAGPLSAQPSSTPPEVIVKNLAENVLGEQTVKQVKVYNDGRHIDIAWESATYKEANPRDTSRDLLKSEAQLATGSIMGVMKPDRIRFAILLGTKTLAFGELTREGGFAINYSPELGGSSVATLPLN